MIFSTRRSAADARAALVELTQLIQSPRAQSLRLKVDAAQLQLAAGAGPEDVWLDYQERVASYNGLLIEVGGQAPDSHAAEGYMPSELAQRVHEHPLDTSLLNVSLRGYQGFGAKFALSQRRVMLGDEMGLGKTIEALAVACHLSAEGETHFLVVCPASVLVNWVHETERHSELSAFRLHGNDRDANLKVWLRRGGVGVTTFQSLQWLRGKEPEVTPGLLIVDEAHYVKNPTTRRSRAVSEWVPRSKRTLFLTGTPMENRVEEFRTLIRHLQPNVANSVSSIDGLAGAPRFRAAVAPVYLRRNQDDVLQELPPRIETEEWVALVGDHFEAYRAAVAAGNFMGMRQAAYAPGQSSASSKLSRLVDIVEEALSNDRKIVVFSFFRGVLATIFEALDGVAMGPLTGSVPPTKRQRLVDDFTASQHPRALISQIEAGGVGLNIQAASVVILAEPQWKPSTEEQAIGRCHRMGQARPVDVHRLLAEESVDQRMLEILAGKAALFNEYVRESALKDSTPDAVDVSHLDETKTAVSVAEEERRIIEIERRRLGIEGEPGDPDAPPQASSHPESN